MGLRELAGEWEIREAREGGTSTPSLGARLRIRGASFVRVTAERMFHRTLRVDDSLVPHSIDLLITDEPRKGELFRGIYRIDGDVLTLCHALPGRERPRTFSSTEENAQVLSISRRVPRGNRQDGNGPT